MTTYLYRHLAATAAREMGNVGFRTLTDKDDMWRHTYEPGDNPADQYARVNRDKFAWGEVAWVGGDGDSGPARVGVLIAVPGAQLAHYEALGTLARDEVLARAWIHLSDREGEPPFLLEPHALDRWPEFGPVTAKQHDPREVAVSADGKPVPARPARSAGSGTAPIRSTAESPTKRVWAIADGMPDAPRAEVVAACVAAGINRNTAGTQYHHWRAAGGAGRPREKL